VINSSIEKRNCEEYLMESLFTVERLMHYLNLRKSQIDYLVKNGLIPHFKLPNGEILFRASEIEIWLYSCRIPNNNKKLRKIMSQSRKWKGQQKSRDAYGKK